MGIKGIWYNELGSMMNITTVNDKDGTISGNYQTAVGNDAKIPTYSLIGMVNKSDVNHPNGQAIGWTVFWPDVYSHPHTSAVTTWSGQYKLDIDGHEEIITFWLLTTETPSSDDWEATKIGQDTFTRDQPTNQDIGLARQRRTFSHPKKIEQ